MADYIARRIPKCIIEYTIEISPPECVETPVKSVMYHTIPDLNITRQNPIPCGRDVEEVEEGHVELPDAKARAAC